MGGAKGQTRTELDPFETFARGEIEGQGLSWRTGLREDLFLASIPWKTLYTIIPYMLNGGKYARSNIYG